MSSSPTVASRGKRPALRKNFSIGGFRNSQVLQSPLSTSAEDVGSPPPAKNRADTPGSLRKLASESSLSTPSSPQSRRGQDRKGSSPLHRPPPPRQRPDPPLVRLRLDTPNVCLSRSRREAEDKFLRQKKNVEFSCLFVVHGLVRVDLVAACQDTVFEIKSKMMSEVRLAIEDLIDSGRVTREQVDGKLLDMSEYILKAQGTHDYITQENLPLQRVDFIQACSKAYVTPRFTVIEKRHARLPDEEARKERLNKEIMLSHHIAQLIGGVHTSNFLEYEDDEVAFFRRNAIKGKIALQKAKRELFKQFGTGVKDDRITLLPEYLLGAPMPMVIPETILVVAHLPEGGLKKTTTIQASVIDTASVLRNKIFVKHRGNLGPGAADSLGQSEDYLLKVTGFQEYLYGNNQLLSYDCVRINLSKADGPLHLTLVPIAHFQAELNEIDSASHACIVDKILALEKESERDHSRDQLIFEVASPCQVKVVLGEQFPITGEQVGDDCHLFVSAEIYHAGHCFATACTTPTPATHKPRWNVPLVFESIEYRNLPLGSRLMCCVYFRRCDPAQPWVREVRKGDELLGWVAVQMYDQNFRLRDGAHYFRMWTDTPPSPIGTCYQNLLQNNNHTPILCVDFVGSPQEKRLYYPLESTATAPTREQTTTNEETRERLDQILRGDPLTPLLDADKRLIWSNRHYLKSNPAALPKFLLSIRWDDWKQVQEMHRILPLWTKPTATQALELLDAKFADPMVRDFGIECMHYMHDGECWDFMLQLTQVLKHEPYHNSALAHFLLKRAWRDPRIGHSFFWFLKAEMHLTDVAERYTLLLESYLRGCGHQLQEFMSQNDVNGSLVRVAEKVKAAPSSQRKKVLQDNLATLDLPKSFQLSLDQRMRVSKLMVEKCKFMDSKKLPLWLVWENVEPVGPSISVIFKVGDDLRQDALTLQIIRIFDKLWKNEGMDLLLNPYGCIATGDETGMIEVVKNADTTANINKAAGGTTAVLRVDTLAKWLRSHNPGQAEWERAQEVFALSCAGYCVLTFVLGIGDRHNDNIMITREGNLFHIDFGHFLGNYKKKYGFKRERAPFIFTQQYAQVLDGKGAAPYKLFVDTACKAFNILRRHKDTFITLFQMMLCTGIPELASHEDIEYLRNAFALGMTDAEASAYFAKLINVSLNTKTTVLNDAIHVFVHR